MYATVPVDVQTAGPSFDPRSVTGCTRLGAASPGRARCCNVCQPGHCLPRFSCDGAGSCKLNQSGGFTSSDCCKAPPPSPPSPPGPPPAPPADQFRCVNDTCVATKVGRAGVSRASCELDCGPPGWGAAELRALCGAVQASGPGACRLCVGRDQNRLRKGGCTPNDVARFCEPRVIRDTSPAQEYEMVPGNVKTAEGCK